jgi:asparagine synthase (glutamine-hydrolysing)
LAKRYLPEPLLKRPKQGFSSALPYMLKHEYRLLFERLLRNSHLARDGVFQQPAVDLLLDEHQAGKTDHGNRLWLLLNSEIWYRVLIEHEFVDDLSKSLTETQGKSSRDTDSQLKYYSHVS